MWNDEESPGYDESEYAQIPENYEEIQNQPTYEEVSEEQVEAMAEAIEERESVTMSSAMIRLDKARLYEMLLKGDLFGDTDAHPTALKMVNSELKEFILFKLEVLLGMRQAGSSISPSSPSAPASFPFNEIEVQALKDIAAKLTHGKSAEVKEVKTTPKSNQIKPVSMPKKKELLPKPVSGPKVPTPTAKTVSKPAQKTAAKKPIPPQPKEEVEEELPEHLRGNPFQMDRATLMERLKYSNKRTQVKNPAAIPMQDPSAQAATMMQNAIRTGGGGNWAQGILNKLGAQPMVDVGGIDD